MLFLCTLIFFGEKNLMCIKIETCVCNTPSESILKESVICFTFDLFEGYF